MTPKWIAEVDRLDTYLQSLVVPDAIRMRALAEIADILAQADKRRREAEREIEAARFLHTGAENLAERQGCHRSTIYRRAERYRMRQKG